MSSEPGHRAPVAIASPRGRRRWVIRRLGLARMISTILHLLLLMALFAPFYVEMQRDSFDDEEDDESVTRISRRCFWAAVALFIVCGIYDVVLWQTLGPVEGSFDLFMDLFSLAMFGYYYRHCIRPRQPR